MKRLQDKVAVVTGSGAGMGEGIARLFAGEGARVVVSDIDEANGAAVAESIAGENGAAIFQRADVGSESECRALVDRAVEVYGRIEAINNAGVTTRGTMRTRSSNCGINFAINVRGRSLHAEAVRYMKERRSGSIINTDRLRLHGERR